MENNKLSDKIIERIEQENVQPKPRWQFLLKDSAIWICGISSVLIGGVAVSVVIHLIRNSDWELYRQVDKGILGFWMQSLPYIWIIALGLFIVVARYNIAHTKRGYRFSLPIVVMWSISASLLLGVVFHASGVGKAIDMLVARHSSLYIQYLAPRHQPWMRPEQGVLSGVVLEVNTEEEFTIEDMHGREWDVIATDAQYIAPPQPTIEIVEPQDVVRLIGEPVVEPQEPIFYANTVMIKPDEVPFFPEGHFIPMEEDVHIEFEADERKF